MRLRSLATAAILAAASLFAHAQPRFYVGADFATSRLDSDFEDQVRNQQSSAFFPSNMRADMGSDSGGRVFGGVRLAPWLALEADYTRLGTIETFYRSTSVHGAGFGYTETLTSSKLDAVGLAAVASLPLTSALSAHGRAGVARTRLEHRVTRCGYTTAGGPPAPTGCLESADDTGQTRPMAGVGIAWAPHPRWAMSLGWERYFGVGEEFQPGTSARGRFDVDRFALGAAFSF